MNTTPNFHPTNGGLPYHTGDIAEDAFKGAFWTKWTKLTRWTPSIVSMLSIKSIRSIKGTLALAALLATTLTAAEVTPSPINLNSAPVETSSPEAELASFTIAPGFEVSLFASEKDGIAKPIAHRFDRLGRLWVIGSTTYPQVKPGEEPNDYVKIVEDTDGDGKADKVTTFAEGLYIPTGLEVDADGLGAWIGEGSKLWHMRDEDGDGKAEKKEVVLRGFGTGDNHQNINSFRWSPGGELYMSQGLHAFSHVETPHGVVHLEEAGYFRFNPRTMKLTPFWGGAGDPQNPWGFVWDDWGNLFIQAGNNGSIQDALVSAFEGGCGPRPPQIWEGARGRKGSNPEFVGTAHFPPEWQGVLIVPGYINNTVWSLRFSPNGSTFKAVDDVPLIKSSHGSFRPMDAKFAPDGSLYIADWFNPVIGHYQASFRHPDRDKVHGRIWRVTAKGRDLVKPPEFLKKGTAAPVEEVIAGLESGEYFVRDFARRILGGMKKEVVIPAVDIWVNSKDASRAVFDALCVHQWHEVPNAVILHNAIQSKDARLRTYAVCVARRWEDGNGAIPKAAGTSAPISRSFGTEVDDVLWKLANDDDARVRLACVITAANRGKLGDVITTILASEGKHDSALNFTLGEAVARLKPVWEPMLAKADKGGLTEEQIAFLRNPAKPAPVAPKADAAVAKFIADALKGGAGSLKATPEFVKALADDVRAHGDAAKGAAVFKKAELGCTACHRIGNDGGALGPDLNNLGSAQPLDFIIGAVVEPSREIKEGFEARLVTTKSGGAFTGFRRAGAADELVIADPSTGKESHLKLTDIADNKPLGSLMPAGLVEKLSAAELRDLFAYLTGLGKAGK